MVADKQAETKGDPRARIVDALLALAAERRFEEISIADIAGRAQVSFADFRDAFPSKGAILAGFARRIDRAALSAGGADLDASKRDRLFDALMRRLDAMAPYREGLREIVAWLKRDPVAALAMNASIVNSLRFALASAGIDSEGVSGAIKLQGLALAWTRDRRRLARRFRAGSVQDHGRARPRADARRARGGGGGGVGAVRRALRRGGADRLRQGPARRRSGPPPGARRGRAAVRRPALAAIRSNSSERGNPALAKSSGT